MSNCPDCCDPCCDDFECKCNDKHKHEKHDDLLKFSGVLEVAGPQTFYLGDGGPVALVANLPVSYLVAKRTTLKNLAVNLTPPALMPPGALIAIQLFKNGAPVANFLLTWGTGETTGPKSVKTDPLKLSKDDLFDLRITFTGLSEISFVVAATVGVIHECPAH